MVCVIEILLISTLYMQRYEKLRFKGGGVAKKNILGFVEIEK